MSFSGKRQVTTYDFEPLETAWLASLVGDSGMVAKPGANSQKCFTLVIEYSLSYLTINRYKNLFYQTITSVKDFSKDWSYQALG